MDLIKEYLDDEDQKMDSETKTETGEQHSVERPYDKSYCTLNNVVTCDYEAKNEDNLKTFTHCSKENYSDCELQKDSMIDDILEAENEDKNLTEFTQDFEEKDFDYKPYNVNTNEVKNESKNLNDYSHDCEGNYSDYELSKDEQHAMMKDFNMDPTMENDAAPIIDTEEEERQKYNQMDKNSLRMRGIVLAMEIELAISNKADNILEDFNISLIDHFDEVIKEVKENLMLSWNCILIDNDLDSANEYLSTAEYMFIKLRPEKSYKKSNKSQESSKEDSILKHVKPKNYQPGDRDKVTVVGNREDVLKCLYVAEKAITDRNLEKAKRFLQKSSRIFHTPAAEKLMEQIRIIEEISVNEETNTYKTDSTENVAGTSKDVNESTRVASRQPLKRSHSPVHYSPEAKRRRRATNCLIQAKEAYDSDDKYTAMKLAKKAQSVNPTPEAEEFLTKMMEEEEEENKPSYSGSFKDIETCKSGSENDWSESTKTQESETIDEKRGADSAHNVIEAERCHRYARKALLNKNYDRAEVLAKQALLLNPALITKALLREIQNSKSKAQMPKLGIIIRDDKRTVKDYSRKDRDTINKKSDVIDVSDSSDEQSDKKTTDNQNNTATVKENDQMESQKPGMVSRLYGYAKSIFVDVNKPETSDEEYRNTDEASTSKTDKIPCSDDDKQQQDIVLGCRFRRVYEAQVEKFIASACEAASQQNYRQAVNILRRSQKLYKSEMADELMEQVKKAIEKANVSEAEDEEIQDEEINGDELTYAATTAIMEKDYDFATMLLNIAITKYDAEFAEHLLPVVQSEAEHYYNKRSISMLKTAAKRYVQIAQGMKSKRLLENAEDVLIIAQNTYPTDEAKESLTAIRNELYSRNANYIGNTLYNEWEAHKKSKQGKTTSRDVYKSNCYVEIAQRAYISSNYNAAEGLLIEADQLNPNIEIKKLRKQVDDGKRFIDWDRQRGRR